MTVHRIAFAKVRRVQTVEETLNKFKGICLVSGRMDGCTKWEIRWVEGE